MGDGSTLRVVETDDHWGVVLDADAPTHTYSQVVFTGYVVLPLTRDLEADVVRSARLTLHGAAGVNALASALRQVEAGARRPWAPMPSAGVRCPTADAKRRERRFLERVGTMSTLFRRDSSSTTTAPSTPHSIFVSIPSYRDPEVVDTIRDAVAKASDPDRVTFGVCQQIRYGDGGDTDVRVALKDLVVTGALEVDTLPHDAATGPCFARSRIETEVLAGAEARRSRPFDFVFMVDAHMVFAPDWDAKLLADWAATDNPSAILTTYPKAYASDTTRDWVDCPGTFLVAHSWKPNGLPLYALRSFAEASESPRQPVPSIAWVAGCSFMPRSAVTAVPYLADVPWLFIGEESAMSARYWTAGFDFYAPSFCAVQTTYKHTGKHKFEQLGPQRGVRALAEGFVKKLLTGKPEAVLAACDCASPSRLGTARPLSDYVAFSGIDVGRRVITMDALAGLTPADTDATRAQKWGHDTTEMKALQSRRYFHSRG